VVVKIPSNIVLQDMLTIKIPCEISFMEIGGQSLGNFKSVKNLKRNTYSQSAADILDSFKDYFLMPEGELEWQYRHV
jgi:hypothetical protein